VIVFSFLLVLAALGFLVVGLLSASQALIWGSIVASAAAGLCLVLAVVQQRRAGVDDSVDSPPGRTGPGADELGEDPTTVIAPVTTDSMSAQAGATRSPAWQGQPGHHSPPAAGAEQPTGHQWDGDSRDETTGESEDGPFTDPPDEPGEEDVSASDVLRTADLAYDVLVVDGRPRYHLVDCPHLRERESVSLPLAEAREAGFTSCSVCRPDSTLAARTRERFGH